MTCSKNHPGKTRLWPELGNPKIKPVETRRRGKGGAMELFAKLRNLVERILKDFATCGVVGEETNNSWLLAATSRQLGQAACRRESSRSSAAASRR